jgi:hypothetical protein
VKLKLQALWKRVGKPEKFFLGVLLLYLLLLAAWPDSGFTTFIAFVAYVLGGWVALRLLRIGLEKLLWRLWRRLMVAYLFIAALPILLVLTLVGLGAYMLAGQVAVYLVRSELDRRVVSLRSVAEELSASPADIRQLDATGQQRFPGLMLWTARNGASQKWPADGNVSWPDGVAANASGLVARDGRYYAWADVVAGSQRTLALTPLTRRFLGGLAPGLGDFYFVQRESTNSAGPPPGAKEPKINVSAGATKAGAGDEGQFRLTPAGGDTPHATVPPPVNRFDVDVQWPSLIQVMDWTHPEKTRMRSCSSTRGCRLSWAQS